MSDLDTDVPGGAAYMVSGETLGGEKVGPTLVAARTAHVLARTAVAGAGGSVRILRRASRGWVEVARYTDSGPYWMPAALRQDWAAIFAD